MTFEKENENISEYKDFPYCLVGQSVIEPKFSITLTAEGVKKIAELLKNGDLLHITLHSGTKATEYSISRKIKEDAKGGIEE